MTIFNYCTKGVNKIRVEISLKYEDNGFDSANHAIVRITFFIPSIDILT